MEIDKLIQILQEAKETELKNIQVLRKEDGGEGIVYIEPIKSFCYEFDSKSIILIPENL